MSKSIYDILEVNVSKKRYTLDELAALERDEPMEFSFRDGYARGYQAALRQA